MGLRGLNAVRKAEIAGNVRRALTKSNAFYTPASLLDELTIRLNMLEKSLELAEFGDKRAVAARKLCEKELEKTMRQVAIFVEHACKGDTELIESSGFEVRSVNNRSRPLESPNELKLKRLEPPGSVQLSWKTVPNSKNYLVQMCSREPYEKTTWIITGYTTRSRFVVDDLKLGSTYWFRIMAIGASGIGPPSEIQSIMAA